MKKRLIKRIAFSTLSLTGLSTTALTSVLLNGKLTTAKDDRGANNNPGTSNGGSGTDPNDNNSSILGSDGKVNYVTFGDSIAAGYTEFDNKDNNYVDYKGDNHTTKSPETIYGDSYSSWVARSLKNDGHLGTYDNYAVGGYTSGNMLKTIDPVFQPNANDVAHLNGILHSGLFSQGDYNNYYNNRDSIETSIRNANLINITIGANDILQDLNLLGHPLLSYMSGGVSPADILKTLETAMKPGFDWNHAVQVNPAQIAAHFASVETNDKKFINSIRAINPNAKIMFVGYEMPLMQLRNFLDLSVVNGQNLVEQIMQQLNQTMKVIANQFASVDYVNTDNADKFMYNNAAFMGTDAARTIAMPSKDGKVNSFTVPKNYNPASWYMPVTADIHPGPAGYRSAAASILSGLTSPSTNANPNNALDNKTKQRLDISDSIKADMKTYNNPFANLSNFSIAPAKTDAKTKVVTPAVPVSYLQPQIAAANHYSFPTGAGPASSKAYSTTALDNLTSDFNNLLLIVRSNVASLINSWQTDSKILQDEKDFALKYKDAGSKDGKSVTGVGFNTLEAFGRLNEDVASLNTDDFGPYKNDAKDGGNCSYWLNYAINTGGSDDPNDFTKTSGYNYLVDLVVNANNLGLINDALAAFPFISKLIPHNAPTTPNKDGSILQAPTKTIKINKNDASFAEVLISMQLSSPLMGQKYYFLLGKILFDNIYSMQQNQKNSWNSIYDKMKNNKAVAALVPAIFKTWSDSFGGKNNKIVWGDL